MHRGAWWAAVYGVAQSQTPLKRLSSSGSSSKHVQAVKNLPIMQERQEMQVQSLGREDPLEEDMATHSSILAWEMPWTEEPGRLQSMRLPSGVQLFCKLDLT